MAIRTVSHDGIERRSRVTGSLTALRVVIECANGIVGAFRRINRVKYCFFFSDNLFIAGRIELMVFVRWRVRHAFVIM